MQIKFLTIPTECPICKEKLIIKTSSTGVQELFCPNEECDGRLLNKLQHFVSKKGLDIKGLSKATLEKLMNWGWVNNIEDIFELHLMVEEWRQKEGFGVKSVDNILAAIEASRNCELSAFISSLGIPLIGLSVAKDLAKVFDSYESFRDAVAAGYDFSQLPNFGYEKTQSLLNFNYYSADIVRNHLNITNENNKKMSKSLEGQELPLQGKIFVITGHLQLIQNRQILSNIVERKGGKVTGSVSSKTTALVNNDITSNSQKNQKAKQLGIPIITEEELLQMCNYNF